MHGGSSSLSMHGVQGLTSLQPPGERAEQQVKLRSNTVQGEQKDVPQAALDAMASSRSRTSLDSRRRSALPREFRDREVVVEDNVSSVYSSFIVTCRSWPFYAHIVCSGPCNPIPEWYLIQPSAESRQKFTQFYS